MAITIASKELDHIRALIRDISKAAREVWDKAPNVGPLSVDIQRLSQSVFTILDEVQDRDSQKAAALEQGRPLLS